MITYIEHKRRSLAYRMLSLFIAMTFIFSMVVPPQASYAQMVPQTVLNLPIPGAMVPMTSGFTPTMIKGITIHPENPLMFDFIVDNGDENLSGEELKKTSKKLIKYFLASLTVPEDDLWVNLSPYEEDRIIPEGFGDTEMGRDLLAMDYMLKQLTSSLMYPEDELGQKFWKRVYEKAYEQYGTTEIPVNTFNKVWIVPESAKVYEHENSAFVVESKLKVMLEEDYLALQENLGNSQFGLDQMEQSDAEALSSVSSEIVKEILIPEIEKEVNEGEIFANLRQISNSMILAAWYKQNLEESLLGQVYMNQNKTAGVDTEDKQINQKIYDQYVEAFSKGVYNYIREDYDETASKVVPRKYFSGGSIMNKFFLPGFLTIVSALGSSADVFAMPTGEEKKHIALVQSISVEKTPYNDGSLTSFVTNTEGRLPSIVDDTGVFKPVGEQLATKIQEGEASSPLIDKKILKGFQEAFSQGQDGVATIAQSFGDSYQNMASLVPFFVEQINKEKRNGETLITEKDVLKDLNTDTYSEIAPLVSKINEMLVDGEVFPDEVNLQVSTDDDFERAPISLIGKRRTPNVLFWPLKGDPWQAGHVWMLLKSIVEYEIDKVVIMVDNSDPERKPDLSSLTIREAESYFIFEHYLKRFVQYTTLPKEVPELFGADGETTIFHLLALNSNQQMNVFYGGGSDHANLYVLRGASLTVDHFKESLERLEDEKKNSIIKQLDSRGIFDEVKGTITEQGLEILVNHLKKQDYILQDKDKMGNIIFPPNESKFQKYEDKGHLEDVADANLDQIGWNTPELRQVVYETMFGRDVPTKIGYGIIKQMINKAQKVQRAMKEIQTQFSGDEAFDEMKKEVLQAESELLNHRLNLIFSQRPGEEVAKDLLGLYEQQLKRYIDKEIPKRFEDGLKGKFDIKLATIDQPMDASSSDVRKRGQYWKVPWEMLQMAYAFEIWGYQTNGTTQKQREIAKQIISSLENYLIEFKKESRKIMREGKDGKGGFQAQINLLVGDGIDAVDKFLINKMKKNRGRKKDLDRSSDVDLMEAAIIRAEYRRLNRIRDLLFQRGKDVMEESLNNPLPIRKKDQALFAQMVRDGRVAVPPFAVQYFKEQQVQGKNMSAKVIAKKFDISEVMVQAVLKKMKIVAQASSPLTEKRIKDHVMEKYNKLSQSHFLNLSQSLEGTRDLSVYDDSSRININFNKQEGKVLAERGKLKNGEFILPVRSLSIRLEGDTQEEGIKKMIHFIDEFFEGLFQDVKAASSAVGGINLDPKLLDLQIKRDGNGIPLPVWDQPFEQMNIEGFVPVIINIEMIPFSQVPMLLGLSGEEAPVNSANDSGDTPSEVWPDAAWLPMDRLEKFIKV